MTPSQVAKAIGCSVSTVKAWIATRKLRARQSQTIYGQKQWTVTVRSLRAFLKQPKTEKRGFPLGKKRKP